MDLGKKANMIRSDGRMRVIAEELSTIKGRCVLEQCQWLWQDLGMIRELRSFQRYLSEFSENSNQALSVPKIRNEVTLGRSML